MKVFPFRNSSNTLEELKSEVPSHIAKSDGVSTEFDKLAWWKSHQHELPNWSKACKTALLIQPSSAAAEHVFSLLSNSFKENQARALEGYTETSITLQYNMVKLYIYYPYLFLLLLSSVFIFIFSVNQLY